MRALQELGGQLWNQLGRRSTKSHGVLRWPAALGLLLQAHGMPMECPWMTMACLLAATVLRLRFILDKESIDLFSCYCSPILQRQRR